MIGPAYSVAAILVAALAAPRSAQTQARSSSDDVPTDAEPRSLERPNLVTVGAVFEVPNPGVALAYERLVHRAFGLRLDLEHLPSPAGFRHLPGLSSSLAATAWPLEPGQGPYLLAGAGIGTNFWARRPALARITGFVDVAAGYRFVFPIGFSVGASAGLRYGFNGNEEDRLCTHRDVCQNARTGPFARLVLEVGWRFGRRSSAG